MTPSLIGKLSQSPIQNTVEFVRNEDRVTQLFTDKSIEINSCFAVSNDCNQISYQKKDCFLRSNRRSQMCINASTTAFARIYLDQALRRLQEAGMEPLYCDTGMSFSEPLFSLRQILISQFLCPPRFWPLFCSNMAKAKNAIYFWQVEKL